MPVAILSPLPRFARKSLTSAKLNPGASPGSLVHIGDKHASPARFSLCDFDEERCEIEGSVSVSRCLEFRERSNPTWVSVSGLHEVESIGELLDGYGVSSLYQEDVLNTFQRPKVEFLDGCVFIVLRAVEIVEDEVCDQQLSIVVTENAVISLTEYQTDLFAPLLDRIKNQGGRLRKRGVDYLGWALLDVVVDHYYAVVNRLEEAVELIEDAIDEDAKTVSPAVLQELRRQSEYLYRVVRPASELARSLREHLPVPFSSKTEPYLSDLLDHSNYASESAERLVSSAHGLRDLYSSEQSNRMNATMRVLTVVSTIFMPMTFLAGIYGMNLKNMPELEWAWFYPVLWCVFVVLALMLTFYFKRRGWL